MTRAIAITRRAPMFRDRTNTIVTAISAALLAYLGWRLARWGVTNAIWTLPEGAGSAPCRALQGNGACWAIVTERFRFILFGPYPAGERWRPAAVCGLFVALYAVSAVQPWRHRWLPAVWAVVAAAAFVLMRGGVAGLSTVSSEVWGGLPLTFLLSTFGFAAAFPFSVLLAFGRRSRMPVVRALSVAYIELIRGVPLITFLFMASVMFPLFVPPGLVLDKLVRAQIAFTMVIAAYVAEVVRGGLEAVPIGQYEAAASLGLPYWRTMLLVVLPQALRVAIPGLVNTFIGFFKDTSLVSVIGLFDLLGAAKTVIVDPRWIGFGVEVYLFVSLIYFLFCYAVSRYSQRLERTLAVRAN